MGSVYLAKDPDLQREVAIKLLHPPAAGVTGARAQFREEARALAQISDPSIVTVYEIGEHEGRQYIAMEYLQGKTLRELVSGTGPRPSRERIVEIGADVARAVAAAHTAGILHRDIKPENIVVGDGVKVVDFGLARRLGAITLPAGASFHELDAIARDQTVRMLVEAEEHATAALATLRHVDDPNATAATQAPNTPTGTLFGTPAYMAPEVLQGAPASKASDVYSLGVMLYECLAGRRPHDAPSLVALIANVIDGSDRPPPLDDPHAALIERMLARDPDARPSCEEIATALAPPPIAAVALPPPPQRSRWPVIAGFGVLGVLAGAVAWWALHAPPHREPVTLAVIQVQPLLTSWGAGEPGAFEVGDVLARLIDPADSVDALSPFQLEPDLGPDRPVDQLELAASRGHARYVVGGQLIEPRPGDVIAAFWIVDLFRGTGIPVVVSGSAAHLARLMSDLADRVVTTLGHRPGPRHDPARARAFLSSGKTALALGGWNASRPYFEQAVEDDPSLADAWHYVATIRGWTVAPADQTEAAIDTVLRLERDPSKRDIWIGAAHFYRHEFKRAREILAPIVDAPDLTDIQRTYARYHLAEAMWHDGDHRPAVALFRQLIEQPVPFKPARIHAYQYALVTRDFETYMKIVGLERPKEELELAQRNYQEVAHGERSPFNLFAKVILGERPTDAQVAKLDPFTRAAYSIASTTDPDVAHRELAILLDRVGKQPPNSLEYQMRLVADSLLSTAFTDEIRTLIALLSSSPEFHAARYRILAAPLLGGPRTFDRAELTTREAGLATAIEAELAGDRATAARVLREQLDDPTDTWDYPERAALARNLIALGDKAGLATLCDDASHPPVFAYAWIAVMRTCEPYITRARDRSGPGRRPGSR